MPTLCQLYANFEIEL